MRFPETWLFAYCNGFKLKWKYVSHTCFLKRALDNFAYSVRIDVSYQGRLVHKACNDPKHFEQNELYYKNIWMKSFQIQILETGCKCCGNQSGLCPIQTLRAGFSTVQMVGRLTEIGLRIGCSQRSVRRSTSYIWTPNLTSQNVW